MEEKIEVLVSAYEYIPRLYEGVQTQIDCLKKGDKIQGNTFVTQIIEGINWVVDAITLTQDAQSNPIDVLPAAPIFNEIIEALENYDEILLIDVLEYEMNPLIKNWYDSIALNLNRTRED